jgi:hypothetical protein
MMTFRSFPETPVPDLPGRWQDNSWGNDALAKMDRILPDGRVLRVWVQGPDSDLEVMDEHRKYALYDLGTDRADEDSPKLLYGGDNFLELEMTVLLEED